MAEVITLTAGADNYRNESTDVIIQGLGGNDTIWTGFREATDVSISGGDGNDSLKNDYASNVSMNGGMGNDIIAAYDASNNVLIGEAGNDDIYIRWGNNAWISGGDGADIINHSGGGNNSTIYGGNDNDNISSSGDYTYINGEAGSNVISSNGANCTIFGGEGNDSISNGGINSIIVSGEGNDSISLASNSHNTSISAGAGDDTIKVDSGSSNMSINGGAGSDLVSLRSYGNGGNVVEYSGDGYDTVTGFGVNDTLKIAGSYASQISGNNVIVNVGAGSILLEGAASLSSRNIETVPAGSFGDTGSTYTPATTSGGLTTGTSQVISNYTGEPVTLSGSFMGATFSGNNFVVNSSAGTLTIQNVTDKVVDLRDGAGNEFIKAYTPSAAGVIDGRGINAYEIIQGASNGADVILAGDGGSQLWGGADTVADAIAGGNGTDIFIGGRFQGADSFLNASSADIVSLNDALLSDIVAAGEVNGTIFIGFNTGNGVAIQSSEALSAAIVLSDGSAWRYNHVAKSWQGA